MRQQSNTQTRLKSTEREQLNVLFNSVIVEKEMNRAKERETRARFLEKSASGKNLIKK